MDALNKAIVKTTQNSVFILDTPIGEVFVDLVLAFPELDTMISLRHLHDYTESRFEHHPYVTMCHPNLLEHPDVMHPFDYVACSRAWSDKSMGETLINLGQLTEKFGTEFAKKIFMDGIQKMNSVNYIVAASRLPSAPLPVCVFDHSPAESRKVTNAMFQDAIEHGWMDGHTVDERKRKHKFCKA
jgi:hypothetical protein